MRGFERAEPSSVVGNCHKNGRQQTTRVSGLVVPILQDPFLAAMRHGAADAQVPKSLVYPMIWFIKLNQKKVRSCTPLNRSRE